jgi:hypothetical protein
MKPQPIKNMSQVYGAAASRRRRMLRDAKSEAASWYRNNPDDGPGGCVCILFITVLAVIVYSALFFCWI